MTNELTTRNDQPIVVCDSCLTAACWHDIFVCGNNKSAGITAKTRAELKALDLEHSSYWEL